MATNQNHKTRNKYNRGSIISIISIVISAFALVVSLFSYKNEKESHNYEKDRDMLIYTPSITETMDSSYVYFSLNNDATLQYCRIYLPDELNCEPIEILNNQLSLLKSIIEQPAKKFLVKHVVAEDSIAKVCTFTIPCIIDYSAITHGFPKQLREARELVFWGCIEVDNDMVSFEKSILVGKCSYPLKKPEGFRSFFTEYSDKELQEMDRKQISEFLNACLEKVKNSLGQPLL